MEDKTKTVSVFTNTPAVEFELKALQTALAEAKALKQYLIENNLLHTPQVIEQAMSRNFSLIVDHRLTDEIENLNNIKIQFSTVKFMIDQANQQLNESYQKLQSEFHRDVPTISNLSKEYINCLNYSGAITIKPEFNNEYYEKKHSIYVDAETVKHHRNLVEAMTYFISIADPRTDPDRVIKDLTTYDRTTRSYSMVIDQYDPQRLVRRFVENKLNELQRMK